MVHTPTLSEICANTDRGGGVSCGANFLVYTNARVSTWPIETAELSKAADAVAKSIDVYLSEDDLHRPLESLPLSIDRAYDAIDQQPHFYFNALRRAPDCIAIAGHGSLLKSLLTILRRPWCILELCCSTNAALVALKAFVNLIDDISSSHYVLAKILLSHESHSRSTWSKTWPYEALPVVDDPLLPKSWSWRSSAAFQGICHEIREVYAALFRSSKASYGSFWIRALCVSAIRLDLPFSILGLLSVDALRSHVSLMRSRTTWHGHISQEGRPWTLIPAYLETERKERLVDEAISTLLRDVLNGPLPTLYARVLREIREMGP